MKVVLFLEDVGHERFVGSLVKRLADEANISVEIDVRNATGGASRLDQEFDRFLRDYAFATASPDLIVLIRDTDCNGVNTIKSRYMNLIQNANYRGNVVVGAPEPHIECWYLADPPALQRVLRSPEQAPVPDSKCGTGRFKQLLAKTVTDAGVKPLLGGIEYAERVVSELDVYKASSNVPSFDIFIKDIKQAFEVVQMHMERNGDLANGQTFGE